MPAYCLDTGLAAMHCMHACVGSVQCAYFNQHLALLSMSVLVMARHWNSDCNAHRKRALVSFLGSPSQHGPDLESPIGAAKLGCNKCAQWREHLPAAVPPIATRQLNTS